MNVLMNKIHQKHNFDFLKRHQQDKNSQKSQNDHANDRNASKTYFFYNFLKSRMKNWVMAILMKKNLSSSLFLSHLPYRRLYPLA
jgi:hypothetical protein